MNLTTFASEVRIPLLILLYLLVSPYTKVEESFNLQAVHDILTYGFDVRSNSFINGHYDHIQFPGAVPRTFVGAGLLAGIASPFARFLSNPDRQFLVRAILGLWNAFCVVRFSRAVGKLFGNGARTTFLTFTCCQFHVLYYASRTLPNFLAFGFTTLAQAELLLGLFDDMATPERIRVRVGRGLIGLTIVGVVFRAEVAALLGVYTLWTLYVGRVPFLRVASIGVLAFLLGLMLTIGIDSAFWQRLVWPEFNAFVFNVIEGKSEEWGVSPFYHYFVVAIPKLLFNPATYLICIPVALHQDVSSRTRIMVGLSLAFVSIMSLQAHKEWRFIVYVSPPLTAAASVGMNQLWLNRLKPGNERLLLILGTLILNGLSILAGIAFLIISSLNYPGAVALNRLHHIASHSQASPISVHMDVLTCMTGVTRFLEIPSIQGRGRPRWAGTHATWIYDKEEEPQTLLKPEFWEKFQYVIAEGSERVIGAWEPVPDVGTVTGFSGFALTKSKDDLIEEAEKAQLAGDQTGMLANLGRNTVVWWNHRGLGLSPITGGRWLTVRMRPKLQILRRAMGH